MTNTPTPQFDEYIVAFKMKTRVLPILTPKAGDGRSGGAGAGAGGGKGPVAKHKHKSTDKSTAAAQLVQTPSIFGGILSGVDVITALQVLVFIRF
jgi:hypothetical protein